MIKIEAITSVDINGNITIDNKTTSLEHKALQDFICKYNNIPNKLCENYQGNMKVDFLIIYHNLSDMICCDRDDDYKYAQEELLGCSMNKLPIIHITFFDILKEDDSTPETKAIKALSARYKSIMDSSSWNYYVPIEIIDNSFNFIRLNNAVKKIIDNYNILSNDSLYKLAISNEYSDLNARLIKNSYLSGEGHRENISPFLFHSEWEMIDKNEKLKNEVCEYICNKKVKWRILFIDDHCEKSMNCVDIDAITGITKGHIIQKRIDEIEALLNLNVDYKVFDIHRVNTINEAQKELSTSRYDIIIIDYLLDEADDGSGREYGYQLLDRIKAKDDNFLASKKGPFNKYWLIFSSGFTQAVGERLLLKGYSHSEEYWYIGRTACPTSTPELFKYNLISLIYRQMETITKGHINTDDKTVNLKQIITLVDFIEYIFNGASEPRKKAFDNFNTLLNLRAHYDILKWDYYMGDKNDKDALINGSPLVKSLFPDMEFYNNAFWEHVQHLIYLVAYGNIRQWSEMWDEYIFIKDILIKAENKKDNGLNNHSVICTSIEKYIYGIKRANH